MTKKIVMKKQLVAIKDIQSFTGFSGLQGTVLVKESGDVFVDLVFPEQLQFIRVAKKDGKTERTFKAISTAVNLLKDECFPEIFIKFDREIAGPDWVHVEDNLEK